MDLAVTLVIQGVVFFLVAWAVMKFGWPKLMSAIEERQKKIAAGLEAANQSQQDLDEAEKRAKEIIREARDRASQIVDQAGKRSNEIVEEAKGTATTEAQRIVAQAQDEATRESSRAREGLAREVGRLAVEGASRLLEREVDPRAHAQLLDQLAAEIARG
jgi:F-type H+-transporting ATPase subunit b